MEDESLDIESHIRDDLLGRTRQAWLLRNKLLSFLREIRFNDGEFVTSILVSNIKYNYPRFQNKKFFYCFYDQLDYGLAKYFTKSKTTKSNIN